MSLDETMGAAVEATAGIAAMGIVGGVAMHAIDMMDDDPRRKKRRKNNRDSLFR